MLETVRWRHGQNNLHGWVPMASLHVTELCFGSVSFHLCDSRWHSHRLGVVPAGLAEELLHIPQHTRGACWKPGCFGLFFSIPNETMKVIISLLFKVILNLYVIIRSTWRVSHGWFLFFFPSSKSLSAQHRCYNTSLRDQPCNPSSGKGPTGSNKCSASVCVTDWALGG